MLQNIYISLGSNKGDRFQYLQRALQLIHEEAGRISAISSIYQTPAWGFESDDFYNCCLLVESKKPIKQLLQCFKSIEKAIGRTSKTSTNYEARCIDIDILYCEDQCVNTSELVVPHPEMQRRKFVLQPLNDIAATKVHPVLGKTTEELLQQCVDDGAIDQVDAKLVNPMDAFSALGAMQFITVEGNIGSGKTTLTQQLAHDFGAQLLLERFEDNPFLPKFYQDASRYAFSLEMSFLTDRYELWADAKENQLASGSLLMADYHISKSLTFAKATLNKDEFDVYKRVFEVFSNKMQQPNLYIYLHRDISVLLENIKKRGRVYEQNISVDYLQRLQEGYMDFLQRQESLNVKILDASTLDFVDNRQDYLAILHALL